MNRATARGIRFNFYTVIFSILCSSIITNHTSILSVDKPDQELTEYQQQIQTAQQEVFERYFNISLSQLRQIDMVLEDLAYTYAEDTSCSAKGRRHAITIMSELRDLIANLCETHIVVLNEQIIGRYLHITQAIMKHIITNIQRKPDNFASLDVYKLQLPTKEDSAKFDKEIAANDALLTKLKKLADSVGLHWYNKIYRKLRHLIVDPTKAAAVPALCVGALSLAAFTVWFYSPAERPQWLRDLVGWPPVLADTLILNDHSKNSVAKRQLYESLVQEAAQRLEQQGGSPEEVRELLGKYLEYEYPHPVGWLGKLESRIRGFYSGYLPLGALLLGGGKVVGEILAPYAWQWARNKVKAADSFLMGGAYKHRNGDYYTYSEDITFEHVIGQEDAKQYGRELCQYLKNPELFDRSKIAPSTGILLFGDTRTGKSFYISALYGEIQKTLGRDAAQFKIWPVNFNYLLKPGGIEEIMRLARTNAPMILVIEEIDLLGLQRFTNAERLANFMTSMSGCLQENRLDKTVIIIGTTNKIENIEPALLETGRFGKHIHFSYPKFQERKLYIERELQKSACNLKNFDIDKLARDTAECSFEKLGLFIKRALLRAKLYNKVISQEALEESIDENIRGISRNGVTFDDEQKRIVAAHLAGHVVASLLLDSHQKVSKVTLRDVANKLQEEFVGMHIASKDKKNKQVAVEHGKIFTYNNSDLPEIETREEKIKQCKINLAGYAAEKLLLGSCGYGYHVNDKQIALNIAQAIVSSNIDLAGLPNKIRDQYFDEAFALLNTCEQEVTRLLEEHRSELETLAQELIKRETLDSQSLRRIVLGETSLVEHLDASSLLNELLQEHPGDLCQQDTVSGAPRTSGSPATATAA